MLPPPKLPSQLQLEAFGSVALLFPCHGYGSCRSSSFQVVSPSTVHQASVQAAAATCRRRSTTPLFPSTVRTDGYINFWDYVSFNEAAPYQMIYNG